MSVPRVLFLTTWSPSFKHAGTIFQQELVRHYPRGRLRCFALSPDLNDSHPKEFAGVPITYALRPKEGATRRSFRRVSSLIRHQYIRYIYLPTLIKQAIQVGRENRSQMVWAALPRPTLIYMAKKVANALNAELVTTVMDPPEQFAIDLAMDGLSRRIMLRLFKETLQASLRCSVASKGMQAEYKKRYGIDSVVLIHGVSLNSKRPPKTRLTTEGKFVIGFAGSVYAAKEWQALLNALYTVDWRIGEREVIVKVLGDWIPLRAQGKMHIEYLGWRSPEETLDILSQVDVTYLPYWFDKSRRLSVRVCFPNKLSIYLAAGRPVLYHGPENSSPTHFLQQYPAGLCCHSRQAPEIIECLRRFVTDSDFYTQAALQASVAVDRELNLQIFLSRFAELIGISETELLPLSSPYAIEKG